MFEVIINKKLKWINETEKFIISRINHFREVYHRSAISYMNRQSAESISLMINERLSAYEEILVCLRDSCIYLDDEN